MSDLKNVDSSSTAPPINPPTADRWGWLKNIPNKILRRSPTKQDSNLNGTSNPAVPDVTQAVREESMPTEVRLDLSNPEVDTPSITVNEETEQTPAVTRTTAIGSMLQEELTRLNMDVPEIETKGVPAIIGTNEAVSSDFFKAVHAKHPDGYLVGVGSGNAYSMLHVFEDGIVPKGVVLADIDPRAVIVGRLLIQNLRESSTAADFQRNFFGMPKEVFNQQLQKMIAMEQNPALKRRWETTDAAIWSEVWKELSKREAIKWGDSQAYKYYKYEGQNVDVVGAVLAGFDALKQLADEDNIAMVYADFTSPDFIRAVKKLPTFNSSTNVIYFSNIADHITQRGTKIENAAIMNSLRAYENPEHPALFIDTLGQGLNYFLRARNSLSEFTPEDFRYREVQSRLQKPEGLLFAENTSSNP